jgi:GR25 family glycosyltransferase involved in LPS biosynthesis
MDGVDVIYWINLDRSVDRRTYMEKILDDPVFNNIPKIRVKAVDGKTEKTTVFNKFSMVRQKNTTDIEYACLLSHLESIRQFAESTYTGVALILEDDITLEYKRLWKKTVRQITKRAPADWDIIQLCYTIKNFSIDTRREFSENQYSSTAYIIHKDAAKRLMTQIYRNGKYHIEDTYRHVSDIYIYEKLKTYNYKYPMFIYNVEKPTTIQPMIGVYYQLLSKKITEFKRYIYELVDKPDWWVFLILIIVVIVSFLLLTPQKIIYKAIPKFAITRINSAARKFV